MEKHWIYQETDETKVMALQKELKVHPIFCRLLVQRGITTFDEAKLFFRPTLEHLHDPFLMKDMDVAVARLELAIQRNERILLYGDYDVDGTTSVAMMFDFLQGFYKNIDYYIPDRYKEGYGISYAGIDYAQEHQISLIIAMDCGITAIEQVKKAKEKGIDFIICDHHLPKATLPNAVAVLDPKRSDCLYPYKELSGCGVAFKLVQAFSQKKNWSFLLIEPLLDLVVVSISCDIVPITGENRVLAYYGLKRLNRNPRLGLKALIKSSGKEPPFSITDVVFGLGPRINAAGRMTDAKQAVRLLLATTKHVATDYAELLQYKNSERKEFEKQIFQEAAATYQAQPNWEDKKSIVLYKEDWHKGIVGIVAARMVDKFHRPCIILTKSQNKAVGSARSIRGFNVHNAIEQCADLLINFGGHPYAAGLTLSTAQVANFQHSFEEITINNIDKQTLTPKIRITALVELQDLKSKFWNILRQFAPFGPRNMKPIFAVKQVRDSGYTKLTKDGKHLRISIKQGKSKTFNGIAFGKGEYYDLIKKQPFDICFTLEINNWKGESRLQLNVKEIKL